jgi:hypothetical protein
MYLPKNHARWMAVILAYCCWTAQAAQLYPNACRDACCPRGVECIPKRATYGFTPTKWRQWPAAEKPAAASPEPENQPTPAKELPKVESDVPQPPSEDSPFGPPKTEAEPAMPQTPGALPPDGLFEDTPPKPPNEFDGPAERPRDQSESTDNLPGPPPGTSLPSPEDADKPPSMEDEDPFKDDPIPRQEAPPANPPSRGAAKPSPTKNSSQASDRSSGNKAQVNLAGTAPTMRAAVQDEPGLLRVNHERHAGGGILPNYATCTPNPLRAEAARPQDNKTVPTAAWPADRVAASNEGNLLRVDHERQNASDLLPIYTPGMRNPLRSEAANPREDQIVPAAAWSADPVVSNDPAVAPRRNPLRPN